MSQEQKTDTTGTRTVQTRPGDQTIKVPHRSIAAKKGMLWTLRKGLRTAVDMTLHRNNPLRYRRRFVSEPSAATAYIREGQRLWDKMNEEDLSLSSQLELAERMELAFYFARSRVLEQATVEYEAWASKVCDQLRRDARTLGVLGNNPGTARAEHDLPPRPW